MFSFRNLNFDFFYGRVDTGFIDSPLIDCSNDTYRCLNSREFRLVLPRDCTAIREARVGTVWSVGDVRTEVLGEENTAPGHGAGTGRKLYVGSPDLPNVLYQLDRSHGVETILWDYPGGSVDLRELARDGRVSRWLYEWGSDPAKRNKVYPMTSLDPMGRCGPNTLLRDLNVRRPTSID